MILTPEEALRARLRLFAATGVPDAEAIRFRRRMRRAEDIVTVHVVPYEDEGKPDGNSLAGLTSPRSSPEHKKLAMASRYHGKVVSDAWRSTTTKRRMQSNRFSG